MSTAAVGAAAPATSGLTGWLERRWRISPGALLRFATCGLCAVLGLAAALLPSGGWIATGVALVLLSYAAGGWSATLAAMAALRQRRLDINVLMILAALGSALLGHWEEGAILLFLFSLSDALEFHIMQRTRQSVTGLMALRPESACVVRGEREFHVPISELQVGDMIHIRPGERVPIDAEVRDGASAVDESVITGEPLPVDKQPGGLLFAGTFNADGALLARVLRRETESTLARIVRMVEAAQEHKPAPQRLIEKWQSPYVLGVLGLTGLTTLVAMVVTKDVAGAARMGMVMLVAASPCAVVLATPAAILAAVTRAAQLGILTKSGASLESLAVADVVAFDKTGTLTRGAPSLVGLRVSGEWSEEEALAVAAALERHSEHPLARAIVAHADGRGAATLDASEFLRLPGAGISGRVGGQGVRVGRVTLFEEAGARVPSELLAENQPGETIVAVRREDGAAAILRFQDMLRDEAEDAIADLREVGIEKFVLLTGDQAAAAAPVAARLGIAVVKAGLRPEDKVKELHRLAKSERGVIMVGDGVNDAPALAAASVGVALGRFGSDVAMESADVVLIRDDLCEVADIVRIARTARRVIQQSLGLALGMVVALVGLALLGMPLTFAVIAHEGTTVCVILNGLRLLRVQRLRPLTRELESEAKS